MRSLRAFILGPLGAHLARGARAQPSRDRRVRDQQTGFSGPRGGRASPSRHPRGSFGCPGSMAPRARREIGGGGKTEAGSAVGSRESGLAAGLARRGAAPSSGDERHAPPRSRCGAERGRPRGRRRGRSPHAVEGYDNAGSAPSGVPPRRAPLRGPGSAVAGVGPPALARTLGSARVPTWPPLRLGVTGGLGVGHPGASRLIA